MAESTPPQLSPKLLLESPNLLLAKVGPEQQTSRKPSLAEHDVKIESTTPSNCSQFHSSTQQLPKSKRKKKYKTKQVKKESQKTTTPQQEVVIEIAAPSSLRQEILKGRERNLIRVTEKAQAYTIEASVAIAKCTQLYHEIEDIYLGFWDEINSGVEQTEEMKIDIYYKLSQKYKEYLTKYRIEGWHDHGTHALSPEEKLHHLKMLAVIVERGLVAFETNKNLGQIIKLSTYLLFVKENNSQVNIQNLDNLPTKMQLEEFCKKSKQIMSNNSFICECAIRITKLQLEFSDESQNEHLVSLDSNVRHVQHSFRLLFARWAFMFEDVLDRNKFKSTNVCDKFVMVLKESCNPWLDLFYRYINDPANSNSPLLDKKSTDFRELDCLANCLQLCIICNVKPCFVKVLELLDKHVKEKGDSFYKHAENSTNIYSRTIVSLNRFLGQILIELQKKSSCSTNLNDYKLITDVIELIKISSNSYYLKSLPNWYLKDIQDIADSLKDYAENTVNNMAVLMKLAIMAIEEHLKSRLQESHELLEKEFCEQQLLEVELLKGESTKPNSPMRSTLPKPDIHEKNTNQTDAETNIGSTTCSDDETEEAESTPLIIPMVHAPIPNLTKKKDSTREVINRPFIEQCHHICKQATVEVEQVIALHEQWKAIPSSTNFNHASDKSDYYYQGRVALHLIIPIIKKYPKLKSISIEQQLNLIDCNFFIGQQQLKMLCAHRIVLKDYQKKLEVIVKEQPSETGGKLTEEAKLYKKIIRATPAIATKFKLAFDEISQTLLELPDVKKNAIFITSCSELVIKEELEKGMSTLNNLSTTAVCIYKLKGELMKKTLKTSVIPKASDPLKESEVQKATTDLGLIQEKSSEWLALFGRYKQYINKISQTKTI